MTDTVKLSVTLPEESVKWLRNRYPDGKSDSERVAMAVSDARDLEKILTARKITEVTVSDDS